MVPTEQPGPDTGRARVLAVVSISVFIFITGGEGVNVRVVE